MRRPLTEPARRAAITRSASASGTSTSEKPSAIWMLPMRSPASPASFAIGADEIAGSHARRSSRAHEQAGRGLLVGEPTATRARRPVLRPTLGRRAARAVAPGRLRAASAGRRRPLPRRAPPPARRCRSVRRQARRRQLLLVGLAVRRIGEADGGERDVDQVELVGQRLHHGPITIQVVTQDRLAQGRAEHVQAPLAQAGDGRQPADLELRAHRGLDVPQEPMLARLHQRDRGALTPRAAGPADAMDVDIGDGRHVEVHDVADVLDVEPSGGDVGRDEDVQRTLAEAAHDPIALLLREAAVERRGVMTTPAQRFRQVVDLAARPGEDQRGRRVLHVEQPAQPHELVGAAHDIRDLSDPRLLARRLALGVDGDPDRILAGGAPRAA